MEDGDLQEKRATGRTGGEGREEKTSSERRLTDEEVLEVRRLIREGTPPHVGRAEVLGLTKGRR